MPYLLDTYNLLHAAIPLRGELSDLTVRSLCQWILANPLGGGRIKATLILDGRPKPDEPSPNEFPELDLVYSGAGISADHVIAQRIERSPHRKSLTVVTNDKAVALHARRHGANALSCESFLRLLQNSARAHRQSRKSQLPKNKTSGTSSHGETAHWLKEFGLENPVPIENKKPKADNETGPLSDEEIERLLGGPPEN